LIEDTYTINGNKRVAAVSLSMGSPYFMLFLNQFVTQNWKDKFIHSFTSLSGPFGGSSFAISSVVSLQPVLPSSVVDPISVREMLQTWGSLAFLFPTEQVFGNKTFVTTPLKEYSSRNFAEMMEDAQANTVTAMLNNTAKLRSFKAPGVMMNCIYGYNISTLDTMDFLTPDFTVFQNSTSDGDGTVLEASLRLCDSWVGKQEQPIKVYRIPNMLHGDAVMNSEALKIFIKTLLG